MKKYLFTTLLIFQFISCTQYLVHPSKKSPIQALSQEIDLIISDPGLSSAIFGISVKSIDRGETIFAYNENKNFIPASNTKLFTTAIALEKLGPDYRFPTRLCYTGEIDSLGTLNGDIILKGFGDPTIGSSLVQLNPDTAFMYFLSKIRDKGITSINGRIIGDDRYYTDHKLGYAWAWDDQSYDFSAQISALSSFDNIVKILISPCLQSASGTEISIFPKTNYVTIKNHIIRSDTCLETDIDLERIEQSNIIECSGCLPFSDEKYDDTVTIDNPALYTATLFQSFLNTNNVTTNKNCIDIDSLENYKYENENILGEWYSPTLAEIIFIINKKSNNLYAELLLRNLAAIIHGQGNAKAGIEIIRQECEKMGIDKNQLVLVDGSGLSRKNFVSPKAITTLLSFMQKSVYADIFMKSLPIAGTDGTLESRFKNTNSANKTIAKTGSMGHVKALSGYTRTRDNELFTFSILTNNYSCSGDFTKSLHEKICENLTNFRR